MTTDRYKRNFDKIDWGRPLSTGGRKRHIYRPKRSSLAFPMVISDHMEPCIHPATGLWSDSKSTFRAMTKASGCIEIGNESPAAVTHAHKPRRDRAETVAEIKKALREKGADVL